MKNVFIDTNIFLDFYHYSNDDISKLKNLNDLTDDIKDITLIVTDQIVDEFKRNRDGKIADALKKFSAAHISLEIPRLADQFESKRELYHKLGKVREVKKELLEEIDKAISSKSLAADELIRKLTSEDEILYGKSILDTMPIDLKNAEKRMAIGNPPGKDGSLGDAINWEILLRTVLKGENLYLISGDGDYSSALNRKLMNTFLIEEWEEIKQSKVIFYSSLSEFFLSEYKTVELDEIRVEKLIQDLESSASFDQSRELLAKLVEVKEFTKSQINRIVEASMSNDQIWNAHSYSPSLIGERLQKVTNNYIEVIDKYDEFCDRFEIKKQQDFFDPDDLPF